VIHLDTSFAIDLLREARRGEEGPATRFLATLDLEDVYISLFVQCELLVGAELSQRIDRAKEEIVELCSRIRTVYPDERLPPVYAGLLSSLTRSGRLIETMDVLIGTMAVIDGAVVVTRNVKHFNRIPDLKILSY
jgi:tRNA(fMet)-specific endonuclease VapC